MWAYTEGLTGAGTMTVRCIQEHPRNPDVTKVVGVVNLDHQKALIKQIALISFKRNHAATEEWDKYHLSIQKECIQEAREILKSLGLLLK